MFDNIKWATRERLAFIEVRAYYCGVITRSDLATAFGMSDAAATKDLKLYNDLANGNLVYKQNRFGFVPTDDFSPYFSQLSSVHALTLLSANLTGTDVPSGAQSLYQIPTASLPMPVRLPSRRILCQITRAIYGHKKLKVSYYSLSNESIQKNRVIEPHTLVSTGSRWHIRAYNTDSFDFRDFVLSRFHTAELLEIDAESSAQYDEDWTEFITLRIVPHPKLEEEKKKVLLLDYGAENNCLEIQLRRALVGYVIQNLGVDTSYDSSGSPQKFPFILQNRDEIEPYAAWVLN